VALGPKTVEPPRQCRVVWFGVIEEKRFSSTVANLLSADYSVL